MGSALSMTLNWIITYNLESNYHPSLRILFIFLLKKLVSYHDLPLPSFLKLWVLQHLSHTGVIAHLRSCYSPHLPHHEGFKGRARSWLASGPHPNVGPEDPGCSACWKEEGCGSVRQWRVPRSPSVWWLKQALWLSHFLLYLPFSLPPKLLKRYMFLVEYLENNNHP